MRFTTENLLLWEQRINERAKSGMSVGEWCKYNEISKNKFHYWNHKISKKQKPDNEMTFAEITPIFLNSEKPISNSAKSNDFQIFFKSIHVTVPSEGFFRYLYVVHRLPKR